MTSLAVSIAAPQTDAALLALRQAAALADLAELRLDMMAEFDLARLLAERALPVIVTCRPAREGGFWQGDEATRLQVLREAARLAADYVDLEWDAAHEIDSIDRSRTRVILSRHDFHSMPRELWRQAQALRQHDPYAVKVVGAAQRLSDIVPVLEALQRSDGPIVAIAMGESGLASRLLAFRYPCALLSFASLDVMARATAPGQIALGAMARDYRVRAIGPGTAFIGWLASNAAAEVAQGNAWLAEAGRDARLLPLKPAPGEDIDGTLARLAELLPLRGCLAASGAVLRTWTPATGRWTRCRASLTETLDALSRSTECSHGT
jgi:3-dehydroquinate dehydratase/shikimate dehydrogenase